MRYLLITLLSLIISSCGITGVTSEALTQINSNLTLTRSKELFKEVINSENTVTKKINNKEYTIIVMEKVTGFEKVSVKSYDSNGSSKNSTMSVPVYSKFYLVFEGEKYFFSGLAYEAMIGPKRDMLNLLL